MTISPFEQSCRMGAIALREAARILDELPGAPESMRREVLGQLTASVAMSAEQLARMEREADDV